MQSHHKKSTRRLGFSMMESLIAISITAIAGALLASLGAATQARSQAVDALVARGLAEQLMDEISATRFPNDLDTRSISRNRIEFNDIDDYRDWKSFPPVDRYGFNLGTEGLIVNDQRLPRNTNLQIGTTGLVNLRRTVSVESVGSDGLGGLDHILHFNELTTHYGAGHLPCRSLTTSYFGGINTDHQ